MFRNSEVRTAGYYYFAPANTPHYPGWHYLGSLNWVTTDREGFNPALGEWQRDKKATGRPWRNGKLAVARPLPLVIGSPECFEGGTTYPAPTSGRALIHGIDSRCWQHNPEDVGAEVRIGGGLLQYLPFSAGTTVALGGGVIEPEPEWTGVGIGGGLVVAGDDLAGGGVGIGGGSGEANVTVGGGIAVGGGTIESDADDLVGGGIEVGGGTDDADARLVGGTIEVGGGAVEPEDDDLVGGGIEVGGGIAVEASHTCEDALEIELGASFGATTNGVDDDYWILPTFSTGTYHLLCTADPSQGTEIAGEVWSGDCDSATQHIGSFMPGCNSAGITSFGGSLIVIIRGSLGVFTYTFILDSGPCP